MRVVTFEKFGKPADVVRVEDRETFEPGAGEALVEVLATPINPADLATIEGLYGSLPTLPAIPGMEGIGRIVKLGPGASGVDVGDRVFLPLGAGTWTTHLCAKAERLTVAPAGDELQLAMLGVNPPTAQLMLETFVTLAPGEWVVQNAANSAVGRNLIVLAKRMGLRTINVVRRLEVAEELKALGADVVVDDGDLARVVQEVTGGARPRLAIDCVGGTGTARLGDAVADGGTVVNYGLLSNRPPIMSAAALIFRGVTLTGFWLTRWLKVASRADRDALYARLAGLVADGTLHVPVDATFPLARVHEAIARAQQGGRHGKVLLLPER